MLARCCCGVGIHALIAVKSTLLDGAYPQASGLILEKPVALVSKGVETSATSNALNLLIFFTHYTMKEY